MRALTPTAAAKARAEKAPALTERQFMTNLIRDARQMGWGIAANSQAKLDAELAAYGQPAEPIEGLIFHPGFSLGSESGWPDLVLVRRRDRRLIFAELKSDIGKVTARQEAVLELLRAFAHDPETALPDRGDVWIQVFVWRPADWPEIVEVLR